MCWIVIGIGVGGDWRRGETKKRDCNAKMMMNGEIEKCTRWMSIFGARLLAA